MINKNYPDNDFDVLCDYCDFSDNYDLDNNWEELMIEMKDDGWLKFKIDGQWKHMCPDCVKKGVDKNKGQQNESLDQPF